MLRAYSNYHPQVDISLIWVRTDLAILGAADGLPDLLSFAINLHLPKAGATTPALELAAFIRDGLILPRQAAA